MAKIESPTVWIPGPMNWSSGTLNRSRPISKIDKHTNAYIGGSTLRDQQYFSGKL